MRRRFLQTYKNSEENLTLVSLEDNNEIYLNINSTLVNGEIEMKVSNDSKWVPNDAVILNKGDFIEYRGTISNIISGYDRIGTFIISKKVNLYGDCTSILKDRILFNNSLAHLFEATPVVNIHSTFLPATTLADNCYDHMFSGCTNLTTAPELPATILTEYCYMSMFEGCTSLTTAPELPATTLVDSCYSGMFYRCSNLNYIKMLAIDISANNCLIDWVSNVSSTGTFVKNPAMTSLPTGKDGIPSGWTVVDDGEESGGNLITFTIDETEYYAEEGMTWGEWCNSEYNLNGVFYIDLDNSIGYGDEMYGLWVGTTENYVYATDIIQENYNYLIVG